MRKSIFILFLFGSSFILKGQSIGDSLTSSSIDSVINHIQADKTKLILIKKGGLVIDSALFKKAVYAPGKKNVIVTYDDLTKIEVKAQDFWGLVNDFGQCQRFHNGKIYIVWHTKAPYVYRDYTALDNNINYFYSENLVSEIIPLTKENIYKISDAKTIEKLTAYLKTHDIKKSKDGGIDGFSLPFTEIFSDGDDETPEALDLLIFHARLAVVVFEIFAENWK